MRVIAAIPAHNEQATIAQLVEDCLRLRCSAVVVANDSSTDATAALAARAGALVVPVPKNRPGMVGVYTTALQAALSAGADVVVELDAGGSHNPLEMTRLLVDLMTCDIVTGCRFCHGGVYQGKLQRKALSWCGTQLVNLVHGTDWQDATSGFVAYKAYALKALLSTPYRSTGHYYQTEMRLRARRLGLQIKECPITYKNSGSSLNWQSIREALRLLW